MSRSGSPLSLSNSQPIQSVNDFFDTDSSGHLNISSSNRTSILQEKENASSQWAVKTHNVGPFAQLEVYVSMLYSYLLPNGTPEMQVFSSKPKPNTSSSSSPDTDASAKADHSGSKLYDNFLSLDQFLSGDISSEQLKLLSKKGLSQEVVDLIKRSAPLSDKTAWLVDHGFAEVLATSIFLQEDDLHKENIGISGDQVVRIDFDMSLFAFLCKLGRSRPNPDAEKDPENCFTLSPEDIDNFPCFESKARNTKRASPHYWPTIKRTQLFSFFGKSVGGLIKKEHGYTDHEVATFKSLAKNNGFKNRAFSQFLKCALLPSALIRTAPNNNVSTDISRAQTHLLEHQKEFRNTLLKSNAFSAWFSKRSDSAVKEIISAFRNHLENLSEQPSESPLEEIVTTINELKRTAVTKQLIAAHIILRKILQREFKPEHPLTTKLSDANKQLSEHIRLFLQNTALSNQEISKFATNFNSAYKDILAIHRDTPDNHPALRHATHLLQNSINQLSGEPSEIPELLFNEDSYLKRAECALPGKTMQWLSSDDYNHQELISLFDEAYQEHSQSFNGFSFIQRLKPISRELFRSPLRKLRDLNDDTDSNAFTTIIRNIYTIANKNNGESFAKLFAKKMIGSYLSNFAHRPLCQQLIDSPDLIPFLWEHEPTDPIPDDLASQLIAHWIAPREEEVEDDFQLIEDENKTSSTPETTVVGLA